jgi:hypothetical protein
MPFVAIWCWMCKIRAATEMATSAGSLPPAPAIPIEQNGLAMAAFATPD